jgi:hypothetical protein
MKAKESISNSSYNIPGHAFRKHSKDGYRKISTVYRSKAWKQTRISADR